MPSNWPRYPKWIHKRLWNTKGMTLLYWRVWVMNPKSRMTKSTEKTIFRHCYRRKRWQSCNKLPKLQSHIVKTASVTTRLESLFNPNKTEVISRCKVIQEIRHQMNHKGSFQDNKTTRFHMLKKTSEQ
jgi:hypothetical protein